LVFDSFANELAKLVKIKVRFLKKSALRLFYVVHFSSMLTFEKLKPKIGLRRNFSKVCMTVYCMVHFSSVLSFEKKIQIGLRRAFIDGSDDRLVDMALAEILKVELPDPKISQFLIVDEFHMLKENHK